MTIFNYDQTGNAITGLNITLSELTDITIPTYNDSGLHPNTLIKSIANSAFYNNPNIRSIIFNNDSQLQNIGINAFYRCFNLYSINIPNSVTNIEKVAFGWCISLQSINIPNNLTIINQSVFERCINLKNISIDMKNSKITTIDVNAFTECINLKEIDIPDNVITINGNAFYRCIKLETVNINPITSKLKSIQSYAFNFCLKLKNFIISDNLETIGNGSFNVCDMTNFSINNNNNFYIHISNGGYILYDTTCLIQASHNISGNYKILSTINNNLTNIITIREGAFGYCSNLTSIDMFNKSNTESYIKTIERGSFCYTGLTKINFPSSITFFQRHNKERDNTNITIIQSMCNKGIFQGCKISEIRIDSETNYDGNIKLIASGTGYVLYSKNINSNTYTDLVLAESKILQNYTILNETLYIHPYAFAYSNLTNITIPSSVTRIEYGAFAECKLVSISKSAGNTNTENVYIENINEEQILYDLNDENGETSILASTIYLSGNFVTSPINFNNKTYYIKTIKTHAFVNTQITSLDVTETIENIDITSFYNCNLNNIILDANNKDLYLDTTNSTGKVLYSKNDYSIVAITKNLSGTYNVLDKFIVDNFPYPVVIINKYTFYNTLITELNIPSITKILDTDSLYSITNLKSIKFYGNVPYTISNNIISECNNLNKIYYNSVYWNNWRLKLDWIPSQIKLIGIGNNLHIQYLPNNIKIILIYNNKIFKFNKNINLQKNTNVNNNQIITCFINNFTYLINLLFTI